MAANDDAFDGSVEMAGLLKTGRSGLKIRVSVDNFDDSDRRSHCRTQTGGVLAFSKACQWREGKFRDPPTPTCAPENLGSL